MNDAHDQPLFRWAAALLISGVIIAGLYYGQELLIPITLALVISLLLGPLVRWAERLRVGRVPAVALVVLASMGVLGGAGWLVVAEASTLTRELPGYRENIEKKYAHLRDGISSKLGKAFRITDTVMQQINDAGGRRPASAPAFAEEAAAASQPAEAVSSQLAASNPTTVAAPTSRVARAGGDPQPVKVQVVQSQDAVAIIGRVIPPITHPLITLGLATVVLIFFLLYREDLRDRLIRVCGRAHIQITTATLSDTEARVARYFAAQAMANIIMGIATAAGLYWIGVPRAALWGLLAAILRFVPFIGPIIAALFPMALSAAIFDGWLKPCMVLTWIVGIDMLSANFLDPWLCGARVGASPTAILLSFVFWSWLWGTIGLLLATPITVCLIVLGRHVPAFEVFYILLSNESVLEPNLRFYQRILSQNRHEALAGARQFAQNEPLLATYDALLLPGLAELQSDFSDGLIDDDRIKFARDVFEELAAWLHEKNDRAPAVNPSASPDPLLLLPGRGAFDDLLAGVLAQLVPAEATRWKVIPPAALASEIADEAAACIPAAIVFAEIEPASVDRIRHICKRVHLAQVHRPIHVLLLSRSERGQMHRRRLRRLPGVQVWANVDDLLSALGLEFDAEPAPASLTQPLARSA